MTILHDAIRTIQSERSRFHLCCTTHKRSSSRQATPPLVLPTMHSYYEVVICIAGSMRIVSHEKVFTLSIGDVVFIAPQTWHYETYDQVEKSYQSFWLMGFPSFVETLSAGYQKKKFHVHDIQTLPQVAEIQTLDQIYKELSACESHWQIKACILLKNLLIDFDRRINKEQTHFSFTHLKPVQHLLHIIKTRFYSPLQIKELAQEVGMSANHLSRLFYTEYGATFKQCLNTTRIHHAQRLLQRGHPIKVVAEASGFEDVYYFTKVFKAHCGTTPGRFLKKNHRCTPMDTDKA